MTPRDMQRLSAAARRANPEKLRRQMTALSRAAAAKRTAQAKADRGGRPRPKGTR